jgi:hypothetical protein
MRMILAAALTLSACGSTTTGPGTVDAAHDASTTGADARGDAAAASAVACGTTVAPSTCALPDQACCDFAPGGGTDYCYAKVGGICEGGAPITCDGPEDCGSNQRCCLTAGGAACTAGPDCAPGGSGGEIMCHVGDNTPCAPNGVCCQLHSVGPAGDSPFGSCRVGGCPV